MMPYAITTETTQDKSRLLDYFRDHGEEKLAELKQEIGGENYKKLASRINKALVDSGEISLQLDFHAEIGGKYAL